MKANSNLVRTQESDQQDGIFLSKLFNIIVFCSIFTLFWGEFD